MIFDRYLFKSLSIATLFTAVTLAAVIILTQSLRFLELVINAGAGTGTFALLTLLILPRFFEIILPIALLIATLFTYNRLTVDSEIVIMRATGSPPLTLARPALTLAFLVTCILWVMTTWLGPYALSNTKRITQIVKTQYSSLLFREGVFNAIDDGLTVFVRERAPTGDLYGLMIHDNRDKTDPATIIAQRGVIVSAPEGHQVIVYDGARQSLNRKSHALSRLNFERYTIDLPQDSAPLQKHWQEPSERTLWQLLHPNTENKRDRENTRAFAVEIHRRLISPLLAPSFCVIVLSFLLLGPLDRRGQTLRIVAAVSCAVLIQGLYLGTFNLARHSNIGLILMYALILIPLICGLFALSPLAEQLRIRWLYERRKREKTT